MPNLLPLPPLDADIFVRRLDGAVSLGLFEVGAGFILATDSAFVLCLILELCSD